MIITRTEDEINKLREAGKIVGLAHKYAQQFLKPGVTTKEIDDKFLNIEKWRGMNKYLKYCMDNYIDKERIDKELGQEITPDVIKYYECESIFGTLKNLLEERWCKM